MVQTQCIDVHGGAFWLLFNAPIRDEVRLAGAKARLAQRRLSGGAPPRQVFSNT